MTSVRSLSSMIDIVRSAMSAEFLPRTQRRFDVSNEAESRRYDSRLRPTPSLSCAGTSPRGRDPRPERSGKKTARRSCKKGSKSGEKRASIPTTPTQELEETTARRSEGGSVLQQSLLPTSQRATREVVCNRCHIRVLDFQRPQSPPFSVATS